MESREIIAHKYIYIYISFSNHRVKLKVRIGTLENIQMLVLGFHSLIMYTIMYTGVETHSFWSRTL